MHTSSLSIVVAAGSFQSLSSDFAVDSALSRFEAFLFAQHARELSTLLFTISNRGEKYYLLLSYQSSEQEKISLDHSFSRLLRKICIQWLISNTSNLKLIARVERERSRNIAESSERIDFRFQLWVPRAKYFDISFIYSTLHSTLSFARR